MIEEPHRAFCGNQYGLTFPLFEHYGALRGVMRCGVCGRRMQGSWNNGAAYYRCVFLSQYAAKNKLDHPRSVYLREDHVLEAPTDPRAEWARQEIADCYCLDQ